MRDVSKCLFVDLNTESAETLSLGGEENGFPRSGWGFLPPLFLCLLEKGRPFVSVSAGKVTGTGAPGSAGLTWCGASGGVFAAAAAEGRFGAYLRHSGFEHLCVTGKAAKKAALLIRDGEVSVVPLRKRREEDFLRELRSFTADGERVIVTEADGALSEDGDFPLGDAFFAGLFREKNLSAVVVSGHGGIPVADPERFLRLCAEFRGDCPAGETTARPARYLSPGGERRLGAGRLLSFADSREELEKTALSLLGLAWENYDFIDDKLRKALALYNAVTGANCRETELTESARKAARQGRELLGKGR